MPDLTPAHKHFASEAFNACWSLIDQPRRDRAETRKMIRLAEVSYHHWLQVPDHTPANLSVGLWQLSRVYSLAYDPTTALHFGTECLKTSKELGPFYLAYAHEALARAATLAGDNNVASTHLEIAESLLPTIPEADNRKALQADLDTIPNS